jgi:sulfate adenylyltransferase subunit 1
MVTGASTAHAAIILVDATRVTIENGVAQLLPQTKRHSAIVKLLALQHVIVAINKMDLVDYSEARFNEIRDAYVALAQQLGLTDVRFVPVSALKGDNIVGASERMPWYAGEPLLDVLESLPVETQARRAALPVQWVARQDGSSADDFRGYMGRIESGEVKVGDEIACCRRTAPRRSPRSSRRCRAAPRQSRTRSRARRSRSALAKTSTCRAATCS